MFSVYGLKKTSIEELAQVAGISKGAFYLFYESKEALFMDVAELAERHFRQKILATVDLPGPSPRARLSAILKKGISLLKTIPLLQFLTGNDYDLIFRRTPPEKFQEHLANDRIFLDELITRCQKTGIPIRVVVSMCIWSWSQLSVWVRSNSNFNNRSESRPHLKKKTEYAPID